MYIIDGGDANILSRTHKTSFAVYAKTKARVVYPAPTRHACQSSCVRVCACVCVCVCVGLTSCLHVSVLLLKKIFMAIIYCTELFYNPMAKT